MRPVIVSNGVPCLQIKSVGSHSTSGREEEGNKERTGILSVVIYSSGVRVLLIIGYFIISIAFFVWVRIAFRGRRKNLAQGAGSAKTGTGHIFQMEIKRKN